jgi:Uma2 family endonuclease
MSNTAAQGLPVRATESPALTRQSKPVSKRIISLETFLTRYSNREDAFKYEWNNGIVEKKSRTMNRDQMKIVQKLLRLFQKTKAFVEMGELICELDMFMTTKSRTRRADMAYLSGKQIQESGNGDLSVCAFVVEIVSKNDQINDVNEKLQEYFENGVRVVWVIFPKLKKVEVHRSKRAVDHCFDDDLCSAAPALPDFEIRVNELFA